MASNIDIIHYHLTADAVLIGPLVSGAYTGILQGGIWTRRLKREPPGNTPEAFYDSGEKGRLIRPSAVLLDRGDSPHMQRPAIPSAYTQPVPIYMYAPATRTGKEAMRAARKRIYDLLNGWTFVTENGPIAFVEYVDRVGVFDSEDFVEAVYDTMTFRITSRVANEV